MFAARLFAGRYFPRRYFPAVGEEGPTVAMSTGKVAIGTTQTVIYNATNPAVIRIINDGSIPVYIGPTGVTQDTGYPLPVGSNDVIDHTFDITSGTALYGIAKDAGAAVRFIAKE